MFVFAITTTTMGLVVVIPVLCLHLSLMHQSWYCHCFLVFAFVIDATATNLGIVIAALCLRLSLMQLSPILLLSLLPCVCVCHQCNYHQSQYCHCCLLFALVINETTISLGIVIAALCLQLSSMQLPPLHQSQYCYCCLVFAFVINATTTSLGIVIASLCLHLSLMQLPSILLLSLLPCVCVCH